MNVMRKTIAVIMVTILWTTFGVYFDGGAIASQYPVVYYSIDGAMPHFVDQFIADLPNFADFMAGGSQGNGGMMPDLPPNTAAGHASLSTGAHTGDHGNVNNNFIFTTDPITQPRRSGFSWVSMEAQHIAERVEAEGKTVAILSFAPTDDSRINGPVVGFSRFLSVRGIASTFKPPGMDPGFTGSSNPRFLQVTLTLASGWASVPASDSVSPAKETSYTIAAGAITYLLRVYVYDSVSDGFQGYDRSLYVLGTTTTPPAKNGNNAVADITVGEWKQIAVTHTGGRPAGFRIKLMDLTADASAWRTYFTSVQRTPAICSPTVCTSTVLNSIWPSATNLEDALAFRHRNRDSPDFAPQQGKMIDEQTYVEQGLFFEEWTSAVAQTLISVFQPDLFMTYMDTPDSFQHQFLALVTPGTPVYDATMAGQRLGFIKEAYKASDRHLGALRVLLPDANFFVVSDHGFAPFWRVINANVVLKNAGLATLTATDAPTSISMTSSIVTGASNFIYMNVIGREPTGVIAPENYEAVRTQIIAAWQSLTDADGTSPLAAIFKREELSEIFLGGFHFNNFHIIKSPDVVVFVKPGYQFDSPVRGQAIGPSVFYGQHGYLPTTPVDISKNIDIHSLFYAFGPNIAAGRTIDGITALDLVPTISTLLGILPTNKAHGNVIYEALVLSKTEWIGAALNQVFTTENELTASSISNIDAKTGLLDKLTSLREQLNAALAKAEMQDGPSANNQLDASKHLVEAFLAQVSAQTGKSIKSPLASLLSSKASKIASIISIAQETASMTGDFENAITPLADPALYPDDPETIVSSSDQVPVEYDSIS